MSRIIDIINTADFVYSTYTKWSLKKYICDISYFTEEPLDDLYYTICSILNSNEGGYYDKRSLGILLGFSVANQVLDGNHIVYYDVAEVRIFEDILAKVQKEHLININEKGIFLTTLGKISVEKKVHYQFYTANQDLYEHSLLKSKTPIALKMFPFYNDMGIYTSIYNHKQIWPDDSDVENIIYYENDQLKKRLELQSMVPANIYSATIQDYFDLETINVFVKLYSVHDEYIPIIMKEEDIAIRATELINEEANLLKKENIILECLFQKLWDDKSAVLNYEVLEQFVDLVDYEELTKDTRTIWTDEELLAVIVERATPTCWRNISRHCNLDVIHTHIDDFKNDIDWPILSERIDDEFLISHFLDYPWDLEILSEDYNRDVSVIENLILQNKITDDSWNWEELGNRLSSTFVLNHLDVVYVNLSGYTKDSKDVHDAILKNIDKRWDWCKIEKEFDLQFIYDNIASLGKKIGYTILFDRIFTDDIWGAKFVDNHDFKVSVSEASKAGGSLSSAIFNNKDYKWSFGLIDLFTENGLLNWASTQYMTGFECNPNLDWTKDLFLRYSSYISTDEGKFAVSKRIKDVSTIAEASLFDWNWDGISQNHYLLKNDDLYNRFGKKLNWTIVFDHQTDTKFLQTIQGIKEMIGDNTKAWSSFSSIATIDYVVKMYKDYQFPWNWTVLTERMFNNLKLENLGNKLFVDKWDWSFLSEHVELDFLKKNLDKYKDYWNWSISFPRVLSNENRINYDFLDQLAIILTNISEQEKRQSAWTALTSQYSFKELKELIKKTARKKNYWWDINYFCTHKDFYVFLDLEECRHIVDWTILSSSSAVDNSFKYNPKLGIKERAWHDEIKKILSDSRNLWDFSKLSHFESLRDERWFITQYKERVDWTYLSQTSRVFCTKDKEQLNEIIEAYKKYIDFTLLSERNDVDIEQIIKIHPHGNYNYNQLIENGVIKATNKLIDSMPDYPWNWHLVTSSNTYSPTVDYILEHLEYDYNWNHLSSLNKLNIWKDENLVYTLASNKEITSQIDWYSLTSTDDFPLTEDILRILPKESLNWNRLSGRKAIHNLIDEYANYLDWRILSDNRHAIPIEVDVLERYKTHLDWNIICLRHDFKFTNQIIDLFSDFIDWSLASESLSIKFSKEFVDKYKDRWDWPLLVKNKAFHNTVDITELPYARHTNVVNFIKHFPRKPRAYHFTHMDNAIKIIRAMKLQSRNNADGNFSNSAGSNVYRTNKAHKYARFYFAPKSPTQFYNECLGKDISSGKYYSKAYNLGLPKCPLPVFFVFDIEELLTVMPDLCYYSNGNMQKDSSRCFKVIEDPDRIKAKEIYINSYDTFDERQQEFLVEGELDFSKLKNVEIACYDSYQEQLLKNELKGTKWEDVITTDYHLYERQNKELFFNDNNESIEIYTDYKCAFEFKVTYNGEIAPSITNTEDVLRQRGNDIFMSKRVVIRKDSPFEVYFEVNDPRNGSWLIYKYM